jgi:YHS domain-containing protein
MILSNGHIEENMITKFIGKALGVYLLIGSIAVGLTGCQRQEAVTEAPSETHPSAVVVDGPETPTPLTEEARAKLAMADAADGKEDHVISKCITCGLAMDGKPKHAVEIEGYTFHLCSSGCKTIFSKDPSAALVAIKPPKS